MIIVHTYFHIEGFVSLKETNIKRSTKIVIKTSYISCMNLSVI